VEGLSDTILENYFNHTDEHYEVRKDIKQMLHFSYFDLTSIVQPPFVNLDLIFCCNVLIYLQRQLQERVLDKLYHSLHSQGYLILGEAETLPNSLHKKLECLDRKAKIYKKVGINL
jgi:two-component system CheB/CheR fusion protein